MKRSLLPLNALRAFDAAARHMSFKKAAEDLSVTPAAISQQIRSLEEFLGVELFKRTNRSLVLTEVAQLALAPLKEAFEKMEESVGILTENRNAKQLRVSVYPSFASKWLVPRLASYYETRPDAVVKISATMALTDFAQDDVDLAIRYGGGNYPGLYVEEVLRETVFPVCAPDLARDIHRPEDLLTFTHIHDDSLSDDDSAPTWSMWLKAAGVAEREGQPALHFNTHSLAVEAAAAGRGVALARSAIAEEDIKAGRLVKPLGEAVPVDFANYVVAPKENLKNERVQDFIKWLKDEIRLFEEGITKD
ncbi:transcriptional regulator GcvA [Yunchengibacter salinarum]|uniref:transcriptional regulator GcvA n=1 Tax=Yunchengibacter salinarum TaxID=3133399 RepID=UPI0035B60811